MSPYIDNSQFLRARLTPHRAYPESSHESDGNASVSSTGSLKRRRRGRPSKQDKLDAMAAAAAAAAAEAESIARANATAMMMNQHNMVEDSSAGTSPNSGNYYDDSEDDDGIASAERSMKGLNLRKGFKSSGFEFIFRTICEYILRCHN
ncbi:hypothetical protein BC937DRAFT_93967 [Endogone sp. FLAS-F59071]|nr:hypothetical protein BC937DRAFT_93967 [Endogone sp. FLAS-F59071]|eukprot:RUS14338.1 hypothetical protein BC937DRAFT_93967 [Endogone sp. FLAS-F59071]